MDKDLTILRKPEVHKLTGLSDRTIKRLEDDERFPETEIRQKDRGMAYI